MLLDFPLNQPENRILCADGVTLRYPQRQDYAAWAKLRSDSCAHLQPFEPAWADDELTIENYRKRLKLFARDIRQGTARPFFIFNTQDELVGGCTISNIRRRASLSATIGYWIGVNHIRKGYARAALNAVIDHSFGTLDLLRLEAACLPENTASKNLLEQAGFQFEGIARQYLAINGKRQDHLLFGLIRE
ncbi:MAG: GNAT family N-acetyltransferase [bacterium]